MDVIDEPADHEYFKDGSYYKIGALSFIYMWNNGHWQRSGKTLKELKKKEARLPGSGPKSSKTGPFIYETVLYIFRANGPMTKLEVAEESELTSASLNAALKHLSATDKIFYKDGIYSEPCSIQTELFKGLSL